MAEECSCQAAGYCERHKMMKTPGLFALCKSDARYRELWEARADGRDPCPSGCDDEAVSLPPMAERAKNFMSFLADFAWQPGFVTHEEAKESMIICDGCAFRRETLCGVCGCHIQTAVFAKAKHCPLGRWARDSQDWAAFVPAEWRRNTLVVIPCYGKPELTHQCVADCHRENVSVLVVDNKGDYQPIGKEAVERPGSNIGWAAACNLGIERALATRSIERVVLLNNDTRLSHAFFCGLIAAEKVSGAKIVHAAMNIGDPSHRPASGYHGPADMYPPLPVHRQIGAVDGTAVSISRAVLEKCGKLDLNLSPRFGWSSVADLCIRAKQEGFSVAVTEAAYCFHLSAQTAAEMHGGHARYAGMASAEGDTGLRRKWGPDFKSLMRATNAGEMQSTIAPITYVPPPRGKPRVGFLTPALMLGGAEVWIASLMEHLDRARVEVSGVASLATGSKNHPQILERCRRFGPVYEGEKGMAALAANCDVLLVWGMHSWPKWLATYKGKSVLVSHGACDYTDHIVGTCGPHVTHFAAVSKSACASFVNKGYGDRPIKVVHNGIDIDRCQVKTSREEIRAKWGLSPREIAIGYVGRFSPEKNPVAPALAVSLLGSPYRAVLVGAGHDRKNTIERARKACPDVVISDAVSQVGDVYNAIDCLILASPSEGFSLGLTEAWYCGVPTVVTPVGAVPELEEAFGKLAVTVPVWPGADVLADAVRQAVHPTNRACVERAQQVAREGFTAAAMGRRWTDYIMEIA